MLTKDTARRPAYTAAAKASRRRRTHARCYSTASGSDQTRGAPVQLLALDARAIAIMVIIKRILNSASFTGDY